METKTVQVDIDGIISRQFLAAMNDLEPGAIRRHWEESIREAFLSVGLSVVRPLWPVEEQFEKVRARAEAVGGNVMSFGAPPCGYPPEDAAPQNVADSVEAMPEKAGSFSSPKDGKYR